MRFIQHEGVECLSFRQIDELNGLAKGSAFRLFKRCLERLQEGRDYFYLAPEADAGKIEQLRRDGVVYPGTPHVVLITRSGYARMRGEDMDSPNGH